MNCRTFAGSLYNSIRLGKLTRIPDPDNEDARRFVSKYFKELSASSSVSRSTMASLAITSTVVAGPISWVSLASMIKDVVKVGHNVTQQKRI